MTERTITELELKQAYQDERLSECLEKIEDVNNKVDELLKLLNTLKIEAKNDDTALELRLTAIETQLEVNSQRSRLELTVISVLLMFFTLLINFVGV